jgi:hypothetical protein
MNDQLPLAGPDKHPCPCGLDSCGRFGKLTKKVGHVRGCPCPRCRGGRNRQSGMRRQREFQKKAGIKQSAWRGANGNEESWRDPFRWEHKADLRFAKPVVTAWRNVKEQVEKNSVIGDPRPIAAGFTHDGVQLVVLDAETWRTVVVPLLGEE